MRYLRLSMIVCLWLLSACGSNPSTATPQPALQGTVAITMPQIGTIYYAETLTVQGTAQDMPQSGFIVRVLDSKNTLLVESAVKPTGDTWRLTLPLNYDGVTQNITIVAVSTDPNLTTPYAQTSALLSTLAQRPEGVYGSIFSPSDDDVAGGEQIQITGTVAGLFEGSLTVIMTDNQNNVVDQKSIVIPAPSPLDEVPFTADLLTNGYTGPATIVIGYSSAENGAFVELDRLNLMLSIVAG